MDSERTMGLQRQPYSGGSSCSRQRSCRLYRPAERHQRDHVVVTTAAKTVHYIRHGATEMTAYLSLHRYGSPHQEPLRDPLLYDSSLSQEGQRQAQALATQVQQLRPPPEVVLCSPLTRALQTSAAAFGSRSAVPVLVHPLLRERLLLSSEVGRPRRQLEQEFPGFDFSALPPEGPWWYTTAPHDPAAICKEPPELYTARLAELGGLVEGLPCSSVAVVAHWGVLHHLSGQDLAPGQLVSVVVHSGQPWRA